MNEEIKSKSQLDCIITQVPQGMAAQQVPVQESNSENKIIKPSKISSIIQTLCQCLQPRNKCSMNQSQVAQKLPPIAKKGLKTLVLDLDETLVHSSFQPLRAPELVIPVQFEENIINVSVLIRPGAREFLNKMAEHYEIVIFTASISSYANPLLDILDDKKVISHRLFREHCVLFQGNFVKDLSRIGRNLKDVIIIDIDDVRTILQSINVKQESEVNTPKEKDALIKKKSQQNSQIMYPLGFRQEIIDESIEIIKRPMEKHVTHQENLDISEIQIDTQDIKLNNMNRSFSAETGQFFISEVFRSKVGINSPANRNKRSYQFFRHQDESGFE